jgi:hypothetical protein
MIPKLIYNSMYNINEFDVSRNNLLKEIPSDFIDKNNDLMVLYKENLKKVNEIQQQNKEILGTLKDKFNEYIKNNYPEYFV